MTARDEYELKFEILVRRSRQSLFHFIHAVNHSYEANWHHRYIAETLDRFMEDKTQNKLMVFLPPQHGKSEITSRSFPAYLLGRDPSKKIVVASYSSDLAGRFNNDAQDIINSPAYKQIFPKTELIRGNTDECTTSESGGIKAVGVTGGLTGNTVDVAIIDDPVKDDIEASSTTYRERVWQWYLKVLETRLHNDSKVILIMTRWHEDDLAGRLLEYQADKWQVISIPAICEEANNGDDPREIGEPLWPQRHSLNKLNDLRKLSEVLFASLYQQRPSPAEGNKVKRAWFQYCHERELPGGLSWDLWIDGAYTKQTENDPTGLMVAAHSRQTNTLYIKNAHDAYMEMPELLRFVAEYADLHELGYKSSAYLEPKASGKSLKQMLLKVTNINAVEISNHLVSEGKEARIQVASPKIAAGRVCLVNGSWNDRFVTQICTFPNAVHDEYVDLIGYACFHYFDAGVRRQGISINNFSEYRA